MTTRVGHLSMLVLPVATNISSGEMRGGRGGEGRISLCIVYTSCSFLLDNGAFPAPVNNEGDSPADLVEDDVIRDLITDVILKQGLHTHTHKLTKN